MERLTLRKMLEKPLTKEEEEFEKRLRETAKHKMTRKEIRLQRISWVMAMLPRDVKMTREEVTEIMDETYGKD